MAVLLGVLGAVVAVSIWWWRFKVARDVAKDALDAAGRVRGAYRRRRFREKADISVLTTIDDPIVAAATLIYAIVTEDKLPTSTEEATLVGVMSSITSKEKAEEAAAYAAWASRQIPDAARVIDKVGPFLGGCLSQQEMTQFFAMMEEMVLRYAINSPVHRERELYSRRLIRLKSKMGYEEN